MPKRNLKAHVPHGKRIATDTHDVDWLLLNRDCWSVLYAHIPSWEDRSALQQTCKALCLMTKSFCRKLRFDNRIPYAPKLPKVELPAAEMCAPWLQLPSIQSVKWHYDVIHAWHSQYAAYVIKHRMTATTKPRLVLNGYTPSGIQPRAVRDHFPDGQLSRYFSSLELDSASALSRLYSMSDTPLLGGLDVLVRVYVPFSWNDDVHMQLLIQLCANSKKPEDAAYRPRTMKFELSYSPTHCTAPEEMDRAEQMISRLKEGGLGV